jgi:hypothetical protein
LSRAAPRSIADSGRFSGFYTVVVAVQGVHVIEHIIQLIQVYGFDVPSEKAFGLLGYVFNFSGTAEWMHLVFNTAYVLSLYLLVFGLYEMMLAGRVSKRLFRTFLFAGVGLETWHLTEHIVIIYRVIRNPGCPCPGIGDAALNVSDVQLHFVYNTITYAAVVAPFVSLRRSRAKANGRLSETQ